MAGLSDLDFKPGLGIDDLVSRRFNCSASSSPSHSFLIASFGRSSVRLNVDSVSLLLQSCIGGFTKDLSVIHLSGWMFRFSVSCKNVGLLIYKLKNFSCKAFSVFFFLWGNGGPNWIKEYEAWCHERDDEWTLVGPQGKPCHPGKKSFSEVVKSLHPMSSSKSVFNRLIFPSDYVLNFFSRKKTQFAGVLSFLHRRRRRTGRFTVGSPRRQFPLHLLLPLLMLLLNQRFLRTLSCKRAIRRVHLPPPLI